MFHTGAGRGDQSSIMMTASVLCVDDVASARASDATFPDLRAFGARQWADVLALRARRSCAPA